MTNAPTRTVDGQPCGAKSRPARQMTARRIAIQGLVGLAGASTVAEDDTRLVDAWATCGSPAATALADGNRTLTMDVKGKEDAQGSSYEYQACVLRELGAPSSVASHMEQTTSMDGRQTESWDGITVAWSFHPDRGSDMVVTLDPVE